MFSRLLFLAPGQLRRAWPFFTLYLGLFAALTLADGLSLALFVQRVGADQVPRWQALAALVVIAAIACYLRLERRLGAFPLFAAILAAPMILFAAAWAGLMCGALDTRHLGWLFIARELALALALLHFGAFLQDYFTRAELNRVMPVIYAGGRLGGIAAGAALERFSRVGDVAHLLLAVSVLLAICLLGVQALCAYARRTEEPAESPGVPGGAEDRHAACGTETLGDGALSFLRFVWKSPLLFWISASTATLFLCRSGLIFQCNLCYERSFASEAELAQFLGRYTQIALAASLVFQLLLASRLVAWMGLSGAQILYAALVAAAALGGWGEMTLAAAVFARFVEGELRYGLRNPVAQMTVNLFPKAIRTRVRAWSMGLLIPLATLAGALGLEALVRAGAAPWAGLLTAAAGVSCLAAAWGLARSLRRAAMPTPARRPGLAVRDTAGQACGISPGSDASSLSSSSTGSSSGRITMPTRSMAPLAATPRT